MMTMLLLTGIEKLINLAISSDQVTKSGLSPLSGKVLRLKMAVPELNIDTHFYNDHVRLEPVGTSQLNEPDTQAETSDIDKEHVHQEHAAKGRRIPDCTISVANPAELLNLMRDASGNLPIEGDYKVLMQLKQLMAGFNPDIAGQLQPFIGTSVASQLGMLIQFLQDNVAHTAKHAFNDVADWANDVAGNAPVDPVMEAEATDLKQQLLRLRADIEREEARLALIKAEQRQLKDAE